MDLEQRLLDVEKSILATEERIEVAFSEFRKAEDLGDERRADRWWDRETQLRDKEKQLREKEKQLREEKAALQQVNKRKLSGIGHQGEDDAIYSKIWVCANVVCKLDLRE